MSFQNLLLSIAFLCVSCYPEVLRESILVWGFVWVKADTCFVRKDIVNRLLLVHENLFLPETLLYWKRSMYWRLHVWLLEKFRIDIVLNWFWLPVYLCFQRRQWLLLNILWLRNDPLLDHCVRCLFSLFLPVLVFEAQGGFYDLLADLAPHFYRSYAWI